MSSYRDADASYGLVLLDYLVIAISVVLSLGMGVYYGIKDRHRYTTEDYFMGNRKLYMLPVAISLTVTFQSSIVLLGMPAEIYIYGYMVTFLSVGFNIAFLIGGRMVVPLFQPLKITSIYEYLELRYSSKGPRYVASTIGSLNFIFYLSLVLCGPALVLEAVLGFPTWITFIVTAAVAAIYTSMGGLKAVVWTDCMQYFIMVIGILGIVIKGTVASGGFQSVWEENLRYGRLDVLDFRTDLKIRHTMWNLTLGSSFFYLTMIFNQTTMQRICAVETLKEGRWMIYVTAIVMTVTVQIISAEGLSAFAFFNHIRCDPLESKQIFNPNQILPFMVIRIFHDLPGLSGLFIASLFSGSLSTLSSGYSGLSALFVEDFVKPNFKRLSEAKLTTIAKVSVVVFGVVTIGLAYLMVTIKGSFIQMFGSISAAFGGPLVGIFIYSAFFPWATKQGVIVGGFLSMILVCWISIGQKFSKTLTRQPWLPPSPVDQCPFNTTSSVDGIWNVTDHESFSIDLYQKRIQDFWRIQPEGLDRLYSLSYQWFAAVGVVTSVVVGSLVSLVVGYPAASEVDTKYTLPLGDTLFPFLPARMRKWLQFGMDFRKVKLNGEDTLSMDTSKFSSHISYVSVKSSTEENGKQTS